MRVNGFLSMFMLGILTPAFSQPPPGSFSQPVCLDLALLFDTSCSLDLADRDRMITFTRDLIKRLVFENDEVDGLSIRVAAITFDIKPITWFTLTADENTDLAALDAALAVLDLEGFGCKTLTDKAFKTVVEEIFVDDGVGDRADSKYADRIIVLTDARTMPGSKHRRLLTKYVNDAQAMGIEIDVVLYTNNRNKPAADLDILAGNVNNTNHIFDVRNDSNTATELERLAQKIEQENFCQSADDVNSCMDIVFLFDVSCSIDLADRQTFVRFATEITQRMPAGPNLTHYAAVVYDRTVRTVFTLAEGTDPINVTNQIMNLNTTTDDCRTLTYEALRYVREEILNDGNDRNDSINADLLIYFGDGNTSPDSRKNRTLEEAEKLRQAFIDVVFIKIKNNRGKTEESKIEFAQVPTDSSQNAGYLFPIGEDVFLNNITYDATINSAFVYFDPRYSCV